MQSRASGHHVSASGANCFGVYMAHMPMTKSTLKTAEPTMVPTPTSLCTAKTPMSEVKSSGADEPAAMKREGTLKGGYVLKKEKAEITGIILAAGSAVSIAVDAAALCAAAS